MKPKEQQENVLQLLISMLFHIFLLYSLMMYTAKQNAFDDEVLYTITAKTLETNSDSKS